MKRLFGISAVIALTYALAACTGPSKHIQAMADEINSPEFQSEVLRTGLLDSVHAISDEATHSFRTTFFCKPFIDLTNVSTDAQSMAQMKTMSVDEFRAHMADPALRNGMEALRKASMQFELVWQDVNGATIRLPLDPAEILQ